MQDRAISYNGRLIVGPLSRSLYDLLIGAIFIDLERPANPHFKVTPIFYVNQSINQEFLKWPK